MSRKNFGQYIHDKLAEPPGQEFVHGKFRFWLPAVLFLSVLNSILTWLVFRTDDAQVNYVGAIMLSVAALLAWICIGCLHYSDSPDKRLGRGVSALDSVTLIFVCGHFCLLMYVYSHAATLRNAEAKYQVAAESFNAQAKQVQDGNVKIAGSNERIAIETTKAERLRLRTAYQQRRIIEAGGVLRPGSTSSGATSPALGTSQVELERPTKPAEASAEFLTKWDWAVRLANFGELLLACATLIYIRNVSAKSNSPTTQTEELPSVFTRAYRSPLPRPALTKPTTQNDTVSRQNVKQQRTTQNDTAALKEGLKVLRETLADISFYTPGVHYKCDLKHDCVWIRQMTSDAGIQRTGHGAKASLNILRSALKMEPERFRAQVEAWLQEHAFFEDREDD